MSLTPTISAQELKQLISNPEHKLLIIDCRYKLADPQAGQQLYDQGHIPGAFFLNLDIDLCGSMNGKNGRHPLPSREDLAQCVRNIGLNDDTHVIVYDQQDSMFAAHLWWQLQWLGHPYVQVLDGGINAWKNNAGELCTTTVAPCTKGNFQLKPSLCPSVDRQFLLQHLNDPDMYIIDARAAERYRGDIEPLDPVAGHIPGAANYPFTHNLQTNGCYKPVDQLQKEWAAFLKEHAPQTIVHQCGSGVSACHNILAMAIAGYGITTLYPGSWSEWCSHPECPTQKS